jgi:hypothetical protein
MTVAAATGIALLGYGLIRYFKAKSSEKQKA